MKNNHLAFTKCHSRIAELDSDFDNDTISSEEIYLKLVEVNKDIKNNGDLVNFQKEKLTKKVDDLIEDLEYL